LKPEVSKLFITSLDTSHLSLHIVVFEGPMVNVNCEL
jgi:hypothetical protein